MDIRMMEALLEALDMAYDALTMKVTDREMAATKAVVAMRRAQLRSDLRDVQRKAA
jgi:hypothetical protein